MEIGTRMAGPGVQAVRNHICCDVSLGTVPPQQLRHKGVPKYELPMNLAEARLISP